MRKVLINIILLILAFTIQICVFPQIAFSVFGAEPSSHFRIYMRVH